MSAGGDWRSMRLRERSEASAVGPCGTGAVKGVEELCPEGREGLMRSCLKSRARLIVLSDAGDAQRSGGSLPLARAHGSVSDSQGVRSPGGTNAIKFNTLEMSRKPWQRIRYVACRSTSERQPFLVCPQVPPTTSVPLAARRNLTKTRPITLAWQVVGAHELPQMPMRMLPPSLLENLQGTSMEVRQSRL